MTDKITHLPIRSGRRLGGARESLSQKLRGMARLSHEDRPIAASNLGRMAASIDKANPLGAAKSMFESAWPDDDTQWAKRKRLLRLEGEDLGNPRDYGAYEAAGARYYLLAKAVAERSGPFEKEEDLQLEIERRVSDMLRGTSLRDSAPLDGATTDARNLLVEWATTIKHRVAGTGIPRLWEILKTSPFDRRDLDERSLSEKERQLVPMTDRNGNILNFHDADVRNGRVADTSWAHPWVQIGWLLKRVPGEMLILPDDISQGDFDADDAADPVVRQIEAWAREWGGDDPEDPAAWAYPTHHYQKSLGHGWVSADFEIIYSVDLNIAPGQDGNVGLYLSLHHGLHENILPASLTDDLIKKGHIKDVLGYRDLWILRYGIFWDYPQFVWRNVFKDSYFHVKSSEERFAINLATRLQPNQTVGLLDIPGKRDLDGTKIMLAEFAQGDAAEILLGSNRYRFFPLLTEEGGAPVPCRANSVAASIFRNAAIEDADAQISSLLEDRARELTRSGLEYHEAVLDFYRNAIRQNGER